MARQRAKRGTGSVYFHTQSGRWRGRLRYDLTRDKTFTAPAHDNTENYVIAKLDEFKVAMRKGDVPTGAGKGVRTIADILDLYIKEKQLSPRTRIGYRSYEKTICKYIGLVQIAKAGPPIFTTYFANRREAGAGDRVLQQHYQLLHAAFTRAVKDDRVKANPLDKVDKPLYVAPEREPLRDRQNEAFLDALENAGDARMPVMVEACLGLRTSEILGLRWEDVDFDTLEVRVRGTLDHNGQYVLGKLKTSGKTGKTIRTLPIGAPLAEELREHRKAHMDTVYVFGRKAYPPNVKEFRKSWHAFRIAAKLPPEFRFYDLRHTFVTLLGTLGVSRKTTQEMVGHESWETTDKHYLKAVPEEMRPAAERLAERFVRRRKANG